ncbi:MAG: hypothetical protein IPO41_17245 [Acidobacteria bacterium]|jgi:hypothetical protein|nr:hypothetical protein [Acidobacteriota bacterium]MBK9530008.1 hypothetical protein [Acidobacteriota bacterium]MBP7474551.1 hypothetical protein [Pyrinomonadaceae bacterium]MBP9108896.1 hypothetical protein [Pyrinomonadaceae bacterium]
MLDENLITTLEQSLDQTRNAQRRLTARLREAEGEVENLRLEINALENSAAQTEKAIHSLLVATRGSRSMGMGSSFSMDDSMDLGDRSASERGRLTAAHRDAPSDNTLNFPQTHRNIPSINSNFEPISKRFNDRTITQACTLLLRESGGPLHVNELYNLLIAGGMTFKGNNPTISVAVSLSRNSRFRKVDPGTFDLVIREAGNRAAS